MSFVVSYTFPLPWFLLDYKQNCQRMVYSIFMRDKIRKTTKINFVNLLGMLFQVDL